jgi:hypothetical protein
MPWIAASPMANSHIRLAIYDSALQREMLMIWTKMVAIRR